MNIAEKAVLTQTPAMRGEKIYEQELDLNGVTEYGVSMDALVAGREAVPLHGARFDLAIDGRSKGRLAGRAHGFDYVRVRADGRMELDLHLTVETDDGLRVALSLALASYTYFGGYRIGYRFWLYFSDRGSYFSSGLVHGPLESRQRRIPLSPPALLFSIA